MKQTFVWDTGVLVRNFVFNFSKVDSGLKRALLPKSHQTIARGLPPRIPSTIRNFECVHVLFVIRTRVTTFHSCYRRVHLFSANKKSVIFSCKLVGLKSFALFQNKTSAHNRLSPLTRSLDTTFLHPFGNRKIQSLRCRILKSIQVYFIDPVIGL